MKCMHVFFRENLWLKNKSNFPSKFKPSAPTAGIPWCLLSELGLIILLFHYLLTKIECQELPFERASLHVIELWACKQSYITCQDAKNPAVHLTGWIIQSRGRSVACLLSCFVVKDERAQRSHMTGLLWDLAAEQRNLIFCLWRVSGQSREGSFWWRLEEMEKLRVFDWKCPWTFWKYLFGRSCII